MGVLLQGQTYSSSVDGIKKYWKVEDLWEHAKTLPVEFIPVETLVEQLQGTCWTEGEDDVTPEWVLGHTRRILKSDLDYPILVDENNIIVDGVHRLCKAVLEGKEVVKVQRFQRLPEPLFVTDEQVPLFI